MSVFLYIKHYVIQPSPCRIGMIKSATLVATFAQKSRMLMQALLKTLDTGFVTDICVGQVGETSGIDCQFGKSENSKTGSVFGER